MAGHGTSTSRLRGKDNTTAEDALKEPFSVGTHFKLREISQIGCIQ